jgi:hypothetical protein
MSTKNNFQLLAQEEEELYPEAPPETELGVMGSIRTFTFLTNVLELYLPRVFDIFIVLVGGTNDSEDDKLKDKENKSK